MTKHEPDLSGKVAVVTGGTRGIGRAVTVALAQAGADVVPTSRTRSDVEETVATVEDRGRNSLVCPTDVTEPTAVRELISEVTDEFGGFDVLVNNAGINPETAMGTPSDVDIEAFDHSIEVNLKGAFLCSRAAEAPLLADGGGAVINVASISGLVGLQRQHTYVASKHGLVGLTKSLALEWAPDVRVNAIAPGYVDTDLTASLKDNEWLYESVIDRTPLERFADPEEIASTTLFLASDMSSFVTGECLTVDGGWTAR